MAKPSDLPPHVQTRLFLSLLEPEASKKVFNFRTFDDKKERTRKDLIGNLTRTLNAAQVTLRRRNASGAGVFVVINEGGQTDAAITKVRAVFADTDGAPLEPIVDALDPHFVIESSSEKYHVYWLVDENFPLASFKPIQRAIASKFGTDGAVSNLSRVMRLPGFMHNKGAPFSVRFADGFKVRPGPRYSVDEIIDGLGLADVIERPPQSETSAPAALFLPSNLNSHTPNLREAARMLMFINPWCDRERWLKVIFGLADEFGESGRDLAVRWSHGDIWLPPNL
jgi:hypothetical protein